MKNIFISSTFIDMQAERDMVQERVVPALRAEARKYGDNVGVIDLRWGVDTSTLETEEGSAKVLKVCLDEIDRSHPYMLIFLGERYGTMMREDQIERSVRGREDKYTTDDYVKSITALEVEYGALSEKYGELDHCVVCFREPVVHMIDEQNRPLYSEKMELGREKLQVLKDKICRELGTTERLITYTGTWDKSEGKLKDFISNGQPLDKVLTECFMDMFREDWKEYEQLSWQDKEQLSFRALMESKLRTFAGREELLEEYYQKITNANCPIILRGETGSGKTAIMCKLAERLQREGENVFTFFAGVGSRSTNAESLVKQMVYYVENHLCVITHYGEEYLTRKEDITNKNLKESDRKLEYWDWIERLKMLCNNLMEGEKIYFVVDALDQLRYDEHLRKLDFFVNAEYIQILASCTDKFELATEGLVQREILDIPVLSVDDAKEMIGSIFASYSRNVYRAIEEEILKKQSIVSPLYVSLLIQRLNMMDAEELGSASTEAKIIDLGISIVRNIPDELEDAVVFIIRNSIEKLDVNSDVLMDICQFLAVSRNGLRMSDLRQILKTNEKQLPILDFTLLRNYLDAFFYMHEDGRIDYTHKVIRHGLLNTIKDIGIYQEQILNHVKSLDKNDVFRMQEGMYFARIRKDKWLAEHLIMQAYHSLEEDLLNVLKNESLDDAGSFYCYLINKEKEDGGKICKFFLSIFLSRLGVGKKEQDVKINILEALTFRWEKACTTGNEEYIYYLGDCYNMRGNYYMDIGEYKKAADEYLEFIKCAKKLYDSNPDKEEYVFNIFMCYANTGDVSLKMNYPYKALKAYYKAMDYAMELMDKHKNIMYWGAFVGCIVQKGKVNFALAEYDEALECYNNAHNMYDKMSQKRPVSRRVMCELYNCMGQAMLKRDSNVDAKEALNNLDKAIELGENFFEEYRNIVAIKNLSECYGNKSKVLLLMEMVDEALFFARKALKYKLEVAESIPNTIDLVEAYHDVGNVLRKMHDFRGALDYYNSAFECAKQLEKKYGRENVQNELFICFTNVGNIFCDMELFQDALNNYKVAVQFAEKMHDKMKNRASLRNLTISYQNIANVYDALGQKEAAVAYYGLVRKCKDVLAEKDSMNTN